METNSSTIIAIHYGHNATVALMRDGVIIEAVSEERFNRIKNSTGFPTLALAYLHKKIAGKADYYVCSQAYPWGYLFLKKKGFVSSAYTESYAGKKIEKPLLLKYFPTYWYAKKIKEFYRKNTEAENQDALHQEMLTYLSKTIGVPKEKVLVADHHLTHALSTHFFADGKTPRLIFTLDGEGDGLCATVSLYQNGATKRLSATNRAHSLGYLYREVTAYLGMKPDEHEFKVMGLAPYAKTEHAEKLLPYFRSLIWLNEKDEFVSNIPMPSVKYDLKEQLAYYRFDNIAGALQMFTEEITLEWIKRFITKTGVSDISLAGGVFMNVKMNQKIGELKEVTSLTITPSSGDESTVFGACYVGYETWAKTQGKKVEVQPIKNLYLGTEHSDASIEQFLKETGAFQTYKVEKPENLEQKIAELLAHNEVVARFSGRMEWGARALGNRSILANPSSFETVRIINEMIKNRDFWMPFAASVLDTDSERYFINPKMIKGPFMHITFETTEAARKDLGAAIHPYDKTCRPHIVTKENNERYYKTIEYFKAITGIGAVLNTSFNLHGEPNVESPKDALHTLADSGLKHLAIGPFLVSKKD